MELAADGRLQRITGFFGAFPPIPESWPVGLLGNRRLMRHVRTRRIGLLVLKRGITNAIETEEGDQTMVQTISREDLKDKIDRGDDFVLVETLPEEQYRHTHLPGALNLPPDQLRELAAELLPDKEADIVVYCGSPT